MAHGGLRVTLGGTLVYCNDGLVFTVQDQAGAGDNKEKWTYRASATEQVMLRWKDDQSYDATRDPNVPESAATGNQNIGKLKTQFIHADETRFVYDFKDADKPITIAVDGLVLVTVTAGGSVSSPFPSWRHGKKVEVRYPDRLVPANVISWYGDGDLSNNGGLPENLIYEHEIVADGTATDTYFNAGGRFFIIVPATGLTLDSLPRSAAVEFTLGQQGSTLVGWGEFEVPAYDLLGDHWMFNP